MLALVQHQVALERLVGELEVVAVDRAQPLFEPARHPRQQRAVQQVLVPGLRAGIEVAALVQAQPVEQRHAVRVEPRGLCSRGDDVEHLRQRAEFAARGGRDRVHRFLHLR